MKIKNHILVPLVLAFIAISCSKTAAPVIDPGNNDYTVSADVTISGGLLMPFKATGKNNTVFISDNDPAGNPRITIYADGDHGSLQIFLPRITIAGTYAFATETTITGDGPLFDYYYGGRFNVSLNDYYAAFTTANMAGSVTIDTLSASFIRGSFKAIATCRPTGKTATVTNGQFKGRF